MMGEASPRCHGHSARTAFQTTSGPIPQRGSLLRLLPVCGGAKAFAALKEALADTEPRLREAAFRALTDWPDLTAWDTLAGVYRQPQDEAHRVLALRALMRLAGDENAKPSPALIAHYRQLLAGAKTDDDRKLILGALAGAADPEALSTPLHKSAHVFFLLRPLPRVRPFLG